MASGAALLTSGGPPLTPDGPPPTPDGPPVTVMTLPDTDTGNETNATALPDILKLQDKHVLSIVAYSVLLLISLPANVCVIVALLRKRKPMKSLNLMLLHLAIADLRVRLYRMLRQLGDRE